MLTHARLTMLKHHCSLAYYNFTTALEYSVIWRLRASDLVAMHTGSNVYKVKLEQGTELYIIMPDLCMTASLVTP